MQKYDRSAHMCVCAYHCAQLSYTTQHRAVLIIFPLILQANRALAMLSIGARPRIAQCKVDSPTVFHRLHCH